MDQAILVSIGLLDRNDARLLNPSFEQIWPLEETPCFDGLLRMIDQADRQSNEQPRALH